MLALLRCCSCASPLPLAAEPEIRCGHCGSTTPVPPPYRERWASWDETRRSRERAERLWASFPEPLSPRFLALARGLVIALALAVPLLLALTGNPHPVRIWIVVGGLLPTALGLYPVLEILAWQAPFARMAASFGARRLDAHGHLGCRSCGAPLAFAPGAIAATCGYCGADSLAREAPPWLAGEHSAATASLEEAMLALQVRRIQLISLRILWPLVWGGTILGLWHGLPG